MDLILWRHAEAEDGVPDLERALTEKGLMQAKRMAVFLKENLPTDTRILVSPAVRTQQTAMALNRPFVTETRIMPGCSAQDVLQAANWPHGSGSTVIVGHQPSLGEAAGIIMTGTSQFWRIKKGAAWWFTLRKRDGYTQAILKLAISPEFLA